MYIDRYFNIETSIELDSCQKFVNFDSYDYCYNLTAVKCIVIIQHVKIMRKKLN